MSRPTDVKNLLPFNGTVQYLDSHEKAWNDIKTAILQAPVLRHYSLKDEVTL